MCFFLRGVPERIFRVKLWRFRHRRFGFQALQPKTCTCWGLKYIPSHRSDGNSIEVSENRRPNFKLSS